MDSGLGSDWLVHSAVGLNTTIRTVDDLSGSWVGTKSPVILHKAPEFQAVMPTMNNYSIWKSPAYDKRIRPLDKGRVPAFASAESRLVSRGWRNCGCSFFQPAHAAFCANLLDCRHGNLAASLSRPPRSRVHMFDVPCQGWQSRLNVLHNTRRNVVETFFFINLRLKVQSVSS